MGSGPTCTVIVASKERVIGHLRMHSWATRCTPR